MNIYLCQNFTAIFLLWQEEVLTCVLPGTLFPEAKTICCGWMMTPVCWGRPPCRGVRTWININQEKFTIYRCSRFKTHLESYFWSYPGEFHVQVLLNLNWLEKLGSDWCIIKMYLTVCQEVRFRDTVLLIFQIYFMFFMALLSAYFQMLVLQLLQRTHIFTAIQLNAS